MNKKRYHTLFQSCFSIVLLSFTLSLSAGDIDKAFKYLNTGDYPNAYKFLKEVLSEEPGNTAGNFGMAKYYSLKDNPAFNVDSANYYIKQAAAKMPLSPEDKQNKKLLALGVRDYTITDLQTDINRAAYSIAEQLNTVESYQYFLDNYTDAGLLHRSEVLRNQLAFIRARAKNDPQALLEFLEKYPKADEVNEAKSLYDKLLYEQTTADKTYQSYKKYLDTYPDGAFAAEAKTNFDNKVLEHYNKKHDLASYIEFESLYKEHPAHNSIQDSIYVLATQPASIPLFKEFVNSYKSNRNIPRAWEQLYMLYTASNTDSVYQTFLEEFPDFPDKERVMKDRQLTSLELKPFSQGDKWGYATQPTKDSLALVIPFEYEEAYDFRNGYAAVRIKPCTEKQCIYFYIDKNNNKVFDKEYNYAGDFDSGFAIVGFGDCESSDCRYGIIDNRGVLVVPAVYEEINDATEGLYLAMQDERYGFINNKGNEVISFRYSDAMPFSQGVAAVAVTDRWFFITKDGSQLFIRSFQDVSSFSDSLCAAKDENDNWGYINMAGDFVIEPIYEATEDFKGGYAIVSKREKDPKNKSLFISQRYRIDKMGKVIEKLTAPKPSAIVKPNKRKSKR